MRDISLTREEAEWLVVLLEDCDPKTVGTWRHTIAEDVRLKFGMISLEQEIVRKARDGG